MKKLSFILLNIFIILVGCNSEDQNTGEVHFIEVEIQTPEKIEPNEEIDISAFVTQGEENVDDALEVKFEIWKNAQEEDHEMVEGDHKGNGIYSITKTFENDGIYYIVAHVTARDMHNMPKKELVVGDPEASASHVETSEENQQQDEEEHRHENHDDQHDHHGNGNIVIDFQKPDAVNVNEQNTLKVSLTVDGLDLTEAKVSFEIWKNETDKHEFLRTEEKKPGEYTLTFSFQNAGIYNVRIHVEKDELHEHIDKTVEVTI